MRQKAAFFDFEASIANDATQELIWKLTDIASKHILWPAREPLSKLQGAAINEEIDRIAFQILGAGGAVSSSFERYRSEIISRQTCLFRAQIEEVIENDIGYCEMCECLENVVEKSPRDASAWAGLSNLYTDRSFFYLAGNRQERASLVDDAERAAQEAVELAPGSYLTKVALM